MNNIYAFLVLFGITLGAAAGLCALINRHLRTLLDETVRLPAATTFYLRVFGVTLFLLALASVLGTNFDLKPDSAFMEYGWKVAAGMASLFGYAALFLFGYLLLVTLLVVVLHRRHD